MKEASEKQGFFQVMNHGRPSSLLGNIYDKGIHKFSDQDLELKKEFYLPNPTRNAIFNLSLIYINCVSPSWRETLIITLEATHHFN